jgi:hypothetical protein
LGGELVQQPVVVGQFKARLRFVVVTTALLGMCVEQQGGMPSWTEMVLRVLLQQVAEPVTGNTRPVDPATHLVLERGKTVRTIEDSGEPIDPPLQRPHCLGLRKAHGFQFRDDLNEGRCLAVV